MNDQMNNQSFDLRIESNGDKLIARSSCELLSGEASSEIKLPFTTTEWQDTFAGIIRGTRERLKKGFKEKSKELEEQIKAFGSKLFKAVFVDEVGKKFLESLAIARRENFELHLRLRLNVPELNDLPWECLYDAAGEGFIALAEKTPVLRYLEVGKAVQSLEVKPPLQVLVVIAAPQGLQKLDVEKEWQELQEAVEDLERCSLLELTRLETPTLKELHNELSLKGKQYHVLHFIGHGDFDKDLQQGTLSFEDKDKSEHSVSSEKLGETLKNHESLRLVFLNACKGAVTSESNVFAGMAQSLVERVGVPAVIAMQFAITDDSAITLSESFYRGLTVEKSVASALTSARVAVNTSKDNGLEWSTPVLFMRSSNSYLFDLKELSPEEKKEQASNVWEEVAAIPNEGKEKEVEKKLEKILYLDSQDERAEKQLEQVRDKQRFFNEGKEYFDEGGYEEALESFYKVSEIAGNYQGTFDFIALL